MRVWRLQKQQHVAMALTGEGSRLYGGRWNPVGTSMIYASSVLSLAALELFVNLKTSFAPGDLVALLIDVPVQDSEIERLRIEDLPPSWTQLESEYGKSLGAEWVLSQRSAVLCVPSVVIPQEENVLINPAHPAAASIRIVEQWPFHFDARMFK